jgi:hypothetical protein
MATQIGAKPDGGSDDPIGMLKDGHRRIESFVAFFVLSLTEHRAGVSPMAIAAIGTEFRLRRQ